MSGIIHDCIHVVQRKCEQNRPEADGSRTWSRLKKDTQGSGVARGTEVKPLICLPFKGKEGDKVIVQFQNALMKAQGGFDSILFVPSTLDGKLKRIYHHAIPKSGLSFKVQRTGRTFKSEL